jgi:hypothetical protein
MKGRPPPSSKLRADFDDSELASFISTLALPRSSREPKSSPNRSTHQPNRSAVDALLAFQFFRAMFGTTIATVTLHTF